MNKRFSAFGECSYHFVSLLPSLTFWRCMDPEQALGPSEHWLAAEAHGAGWFQTVSSWDPASPGCGAVCILGKLALGDSMPPQLLASC